jgi:CHRD domain
MKLKIFLSTILIIPFIILYGLLSIAGQNVNAFEEYRSSIFIAPLDPYQIISEEEDTHISSESHGVVYLSINPFSYELSYEVFLEGLSYEEGDDVEIIQIHLEIPGENGPIVLSLCDEKKGKGHCREGPGLSVEGILNGKDLKGPLKDASLNELVELIESGESYVHVQTRDHPEGEIRGQIYHY